MFQYSIHISKKDDPLFGITNLELEDCFFEKPLSELSGDDIEEARLWLIERLCRVVLYRVDYPVWDTGRYLRLFRNAHLLRIEGIKIAACAFDRTDQNETALREIIRMAETFGIRILFEPDSSEENTFERYGELRSANTGLIFNPVEMVRMGQNPFLKVLYKNKYKDDIVFLRVNDGLYGSGEPVLPECGNSEIKECSSALLSRSFDGYFAFNAYSEDFSVDSVIRAFQSTLSQM